MGVERLLSFAGLVLMAMLLPLVISSRRHAMPDFDLGHLTKKLDKANPIHIFANKVRPRHNHCDQYPYFDLPFCPSAESILNDRKKSLEELLAGDCFTLTQYELKFGKDTEGKLLCEKILTKDEVKKFRDAIKRDFEYQLVFNKNVLQGMVGKIVEGKNPKYYLVTRIGFYIKYSNNQVKDLYVVNHHYLDVDITKDAAIKVNFTYSVYWDEVIPESSNVLLNHTPFDESQRLEEEQGIWDSWLLFWACLALVWIVLVLIVTVPYLKNYFGRYCHREEDDLDLVVVSPHHIHGDNCKCPPYTSLLGAILGNGIQLIITVCIFFILAYKGLLYPCNPQYLSSQIMGIYCFTSVVAGSKATAFHDGFTPVGWKECIVQAGALYFIPALSTALMANGLAISKFGISKVPELGIIYENLAVWGLVTGIMLILSSILARCSKSDSQPTCATRKLPRETRQQPWYMKTPAQMLLSGLVTFIVIFPEMDNIYASLWNFKICGAFCTLLSSFIVLVVMTMILAIGFTSYQLSKHDHQWWWKSVLRGGSPAIFMFLYGLYFFSKVNFEESLLYRMLGYHACISYAFFLILGTIGYYASSFVFHCTYHLPKHE